MGRGRLVDPWRSRGDAPQLPNPEPRLTRLLGVVDQCSKWGLFTRPITGNWGRGRIQLIGDAAHAMLPSAGQGACQAFEDAYILGRWLKEHHDPVEAFANFRRVRIPRVHGVQRLSLANKNFRHMTGHREAKGSNRFRQSQRPGPMSIGSGDTRSSTNGTKSPLFPPFTPLTSNRHSLQDEREGLRNLNAPTPLPGHDATRKTLAKIDPALRPQISLLQPRMHR